MSALAGIVLCGGQSSRMGASKAWLDFGGEPLLARTVRVMADAVTEVVVVAAPGQDLPSLPPGAAVVYDEVTGRGPLQGLAAGLAAIAPRAPAAFVSSTDAPFLHTELVRRLAELYSEGHDIVVPRVGDRLHPLAAVYGVAVLPEITASLAAGRLRLTALFDRARTLVADEPLLLAGEALRAADPALRSLANLNTPEDYAAALAEAGLSSTIPS